MFWWSLIYQFCYVLSLCFLCRIEVPSPDLQIYIIKHDICCALWLLILYQVAKSHYSSYFAEFLSRMDVRFCQMFFFVGMSYVFSLLLIWWITLNDFSDVEPALHSCSWSICIYIFKNHYFYWGVTDIYNIVLFQVYGIMIYVCLHWEVIPHSQNPSSYIVRRKSFFLCWGLLRSQQLSNMQCSVDDNCRAIHYVPRLSYL